MFQKDTVSKMDGLVSSALSMADRLGHRRSPVSDGTESQKVAS